MNQYFRLRFLIEGVPELSRVLLMTHKKLDDFSKPLFKASQMILDDVETQFRTEGSLSGGWTPLKLSTIIDKAKKGYGGKPILERTGALKKSFYRQVNSRRAYISSRSPYFGFHQSRQARTTELPRRPMLLLTQSTKEKIVKEFHKFIRFT